MRADTMPLELRVLEGPQAGARAPWPADADLVLAIGGEASTETADLVLIGDAGQPIRLRLTGPRPLATVAVLQGTVRLGDRELASGATADWPPGRRLAAGATVLAFGPAAQAIWPDEAEAAIDPSAGPADPAAADGGRGLVEPEAGPSGGAMRRRAGNGPGARAAPWLAATGASVALVCAAAFWLLHPAGQGASPDAAPPAPAVQLPPAFAHLRLVAREDGSAAIGGRLATRGEREQLDAWLAAHAVPARVDVLVDEQLAGDVADVFRVNGVAVRTRVQGPGRVLAEAAERDPLRLARAEEVVRRDVRGLEALTLENTVVPLPPPPSPPVPDDPGKRIASLVPGAPGYLITADGARYFVGAMLPTGHRIAQIARASVVLERDGRTSRLDF